MANGVTNPDIVGQFLRGRQAKQQNELFQQQLAGNKQKQEQLASQQQLAGETRQLSGQILSGEDVDNNLKTLFQKNPEAAQGVLTSLGINNQRKADEAADFAFKLRNVPFEQRQGKINERVQLLDSQGRPSKDTAELLNLNQQQQDNALRVVEQASLSVKERQKANKQIKSASLSEFETLTEDLPAEQKKEATLIKLGLSPRAVGSAIQTITDKGIEEEIGKASATIKQREKFGELTGTSRAKAIDKGFETIGKINAGVRNIDKAITALNEGAGVGAIEKFLPSFKASSVELDNIQKAMALDVIGAVTFGALSAGELNLAREVALPTGLDTPQLIEHLQKRKVAQEKLRSYFEEQIQFLDQGGTIAGFLRSKDNEAGDQEVDQSVSLPPALARADDAGEIMIDAEGNRARVFKDGTFEEL